MNDRLKGKIINLSFQLFFYCPTIYFIFAESSAMKHAAGAVDKLQPGSSGARLSPVGTSEPVCTRQRRHQSCLRGTLLLQVPRCPVTTPAWRRRGLRETGALRWGWALGHTTPEPWPPAHLGLPTPRCLFQVGLAVLPRGSGAATCLSGSETSRALSRCPLHWQSSSVSLRRCFGLLLERRVMAVLSHAIQEAVSVPAVATRSLPLCFVHFPT